MTTLQPFYESFKHRVDHEDFHVGKAAVPVLLGRNVKERVFASTFAQRRAPHCVTVVHKIHWLIGDHRQQLFLTFCGHRGDTYVRMLVYGAQILHFGMLTTFTSLLRLVLCISSHVILTKAVHCIGLIRFLSLASNILGRLFLLSRDATVFCCSCCYQIAVL